MLLTAGRPLTGRAQGSFRPGYLVRPAGDTVRGEVDLRDLRLAGRQCRFRPAPTAEVTTYGPAQLRAYGIPAAGLHYRALALPGAAAGSAPTAFMQVEVSGPASFYSWRDDAAHYYIATASFPLTELVQKQEQVELEENGFKRKYEETKSIYRQTLAQALAGCLQAQVLLPRLPYTVVALAQAVAAYNKCQGQPGDAYSIRATAAKLRAQLGLVLGYQNATMRTSSDVSNYNVDFGSSSGLTGGLALGLPLTSLSRQLTLELELLYQTQHYTGTNSYASSSGNGYVYNANYQADFSYLKLPVLLRYTLKRAALVRPFLELGGTLGYALRLQTTATTSGVGTASYLGDDYRHFQEGLVGGLGLEFDLVKNHPAAVLVRYEADTGWINSNNISSRVTHLYAQFSFSLTKQTSR
ncbi:porin family protein [Hymenobacter sp. BRD67]|uniref:porin family protein n=1 Tax=Hymenobacter sp. BRD67 TaxID=2675877 RepID=UPI0015676411|nr:porin family protein [Hymenobacter sp. BRD67]QKG52368.1 PorT family protein [Hymenobacter sp. BRD67]